MFAGRHVRYASVCAFRWSWKLLSRTQKRCVFVQVLSGDTVIVRGPPRGGPPPERTIGLSNVTAPRLARRPGIADESKESKDEVQSIFVPSVYTCPVDYCISVWKWLVILYLFNNKRLLRLNFFHFNKLPNLHEVLTLMYFNSLQSVKGTGVWMLMTLSDDAKKCNIRHDSFVKL